MVRRSAPWELGTRYIRADGSGVMPKPKDRGASSSSSSSYSSSSSSSSSGEGGVLARSSPSASAPASEAEGDDGACLAAQVWDRRVDRAATAGSASSSSIWMKVFLVVTWKPKHCE